ncbi:WD40 repeat domain-containing protein, partial [Candidatus Dependentiae bacterium]|nr:WD40 repeat domain-containing protein [Candidatus Dependentiae bacterium]
STNKNQRIVNCIPQSLHYLQKLTEYTVSLSDESTLTHHFICSKVLAGHTGGIYALAVSPDGNTLFTQSDDTTARLWDISTGTQIHLQKGSISWMPSAAHNSEGTMLLVGHDDCSARLIDIKTEKELRIFKGHTDWIESVAWSPKEKTVVTGSADCTSRVWNVMTGQELYILKGHTGWVNAVEYSPDGKIILTGANDTSARLWNSTTGKELNLLLGHTDSVRSVAWSPDGKIIFTGSSDGTVRVWTQVEPIRPHTIKEEDFNELPVECNLLIKNNENSDCVLSSENKNEENLTIEDVSTKTEVLGFTEAINLDDDSQKECSIH